MTDQSIVNATWVMAIAACLSFGVILIQAIYIRKQTGILNEQIEANRKIVDIEQKRDRQANFISSWIITEIGNAPGRPDKAWTLAVRNSSLQPVYDITHVVTFKKNGEWLALEYSTMNQLNRVDVLPPSDVSDMLYLSAVVVSISGDEYVVEHFGSRNTWLSRSNPRKLSTLGLDMGSEYIFSSEISFRVADGSSWTRTSNGELNSLTPEIPKDRKRWFHL